MNAKARLNLLLSDILHCESSPNKKFYQGSSTQTEPSLTFAAHDYQSSSVLPSTIVTSSSVTPVPPHRTSSSLKHQRQCYRLQRSDLPQQQQQQPLLNSSTLDDLFRALTLECEQYLANPSTASFQNKTYDEIRVRSTTKIPTALDSNDDDYENLHSSKLTSSNSVSSLKTNIEVFSPEKRQVLSMSVSSKSSPSPTVSSSQTYPLLSTTCMSTSMRPPISCLSSDDDCIDACSSNVNRKRRRRARKQHVQSAKVRLHSSSDEQTETISASITVKKPTATKRSFSTDQRQQRIKSIYDNHPISTSAQKLPTKRTRRRDISLQQHLPTQTESHEGTLPHFPTDLCSPISVLLKAARTPSDFVDRTQLPPQRRSRLESVNTQPLTLLDRMHHQFYQAPQMYHVNNHNNNTNNNNNNNHYNYNYNGIDNNNNNHNNNNNIPALRMPSYPVY